MKYMRTNQGVYSALPLEELPQGTQMIHVVDQQALSKHVDSRSTECSWCRT